ncbi:efflux RND transporter periplasmic adaptor subunit [Persicirhabdus sediminis]|uniref:Efflux RND transporter periplasmic adaptor subunit n=1 Tax=Persicirhabdus sediminis TaxID=454144 RepID=A0A8J7SHG4_9BACT|nr:efflux RND transporter periplasmic adaptor subunit [Persicirhabdus sediminis]MBK1789821.1 efflux RND transporter periplasmic adaptor subunit [Persicirhabdus sediminis]
MKSSIKITKLPAVALIAAGGSLLTLNSCKETNNYVAPPAPKVSVQNPTTNDVTVFAKFPAQVQAIEDVVIQARVPGFLEKIEFRDGQDVKAGQRLFLIEQGEYIAARDNADAMVAKAKAELDLANASYKRMQEAFANQSVSEIAVLESEAQQQGAKATLLSAEAQLKSAELQLSYTEVISPIDGVVADRLVSTGNMVGVSGAADLTSVVSLQPLHVYFNIDERVMLSFQKLEKEENKKPTDLDLQLKLTDGSIFNETGKFDYIENTIDKSTGTLRVRALFENKERLLRPGQFARMLIPHVYENVITVPTHAIQRDMEGYYVMTVNEKNEVVRKMVKPGEISGLRRIVFEGLTVDDKVITKGLQRARPGATVAPELIESTETLDERGPEDSKAEPTDKAAEQKPAAENEAADKADK